MENFIFCAVCKVNFLQLVNGNICLFGHHLDMCICTLWGQKAKIPANSQALYGLVHGTYWLEMG